MVEGPTKEPAMVTETEAKLADPDNSGFYGKDGAAAAAQAAASTAWEHATPAGTGNPPPMPPRTPGENGATDGKFFGGSSNLGSNLGSNLSGLTDSGAKVGRDVKGVFAAAHVSLPSC